MWKLARDLKIGPLYCARSALHTKPNFILALYIWRFSNTQPHFVVKVIRVVYEGKCRWCKRGRVWWYTRTFAVVRSAMSITNAFTEEVRSHARAPGAGDQVPSEELARRAVELGMCVIVWLNGYECRMLFRARTIPDIWLVLVEAILVPAEA